MTHLELQRLEVGPWPMNCYLLRCPETGRLAIVDPGADADKILEAVRQAHVDCILLTHGHPDHVGALEDVREATGAPVGIHPADAERFDVRAEIVLEDGVVVKVGKGQVRVTHVPGHTPGSVCLRLDGKVVAGDAIFPGGPGYTASPEALTQSLDSLARTVFVWPDDTELYPGHGGHTTVQAERAAFQRFLSADRPADLCGDVTWG
jgi:glyoxylase-like metal-dependent hydrolase (beta-lactamase superfamily II)